MQGGSANQFCISTSWGFAHYKKVSDRLEEGGYYIVESRGHGAVSSQQPQALLEPSLPKVAVEYSINNKEVLDAKNSMEVWFSLFQDLIKAEARGAARALNP